MVESDLRITVLVAVYNGLPHVQGAVESVLGQTYGGFELIIVDDGSTDGTAEYLADITDSRVRVIRVDHVGLTQALVVGMGEARGELIARQDADDISIPERLQIEVDYLDANPDVAVVGTCYTVIDQTGRALFDRKLPTGDAIREAMQRRHGPLAHGSVLMRKEVVESVGTYRPEFRYAQDLDLWLRIAENHKIENIPLYLYEWRLPESGGSAVKRFQQRRYAELAVECARARAGGMPEPLDRVRDVANARPSVLWRVGFRAKATWRRLTNSLGIDVSPPYMGESDS